MSIATSVLVIPSRSLLLMTAVLCVCTAAVGCAVGLGAVGELGAWAGWTCALGCVTLAGVGLLTMMQCRKIYHIDISGSGQIRLRFVAPDPRETPKLAAKEHNADGALVTLLADSTLWSRFLMLRLRDEGGRVHVLPILPDSVSAESFRALSVACRWIAAHRFSELN